MQSSAVQCSAELQPWATSDRQIPRSEAAGRGGATATQLIQGADF
jgi:hypothetical protein